MKTFFFYTYRHKFYPNYKYITDIVIEQQTNFTILLTTYIVSL